MLESTSSSSCTRFAVVLFAAIVLSSPALAPVQAQRERFNPDGSFWILGQPLKGFTDFGGINLNSNRNRRLPRAGVDLTNGTQLRFKTVAVGRDRFTFTTVAVGGMSYSFKGKFLVGGVFAARDLEETPVLEGTLTKFKDGRKVAEAKLKFSYFGGT